MIGLFRLKRFIVKRFKNRVFRKINLYFTWWTEASLIANEVMYEEFTYSHISDIIGLVDTFKINKSYKKDRYLVRSKLSLKSRTIIIEDTIEKIKLTITLYENRKVTSVHFCDNGLTYLYELASGMIDNSINHKEIGHKVENLLSKISILLMKDYFLKVDLI